MPHPTTLVALRGIARGLLATAPLLASPVPVSAQDSIPPANAASAPDASTRADSRRFERSLFLEDSASTSANVSLGDVTGDGLLDVILVKGRHWPDQNLVRAGDGRGGFGPAVPVGPGPDRSYSGELVDLDDDGDLDLVVSNDAPDPKRILHNDGRGGFTEVAQFGAPEWTTRHIAVADLNGDGHRDVIVANRGGPEGTSSFVCFGEPRGRLRGPCREVYVGSATTITPADMNGDGRVDLVVPHRDGGQSFVLLNDGAGGFSRRIEFGPADAAFRSARVGDFDGDGRPDIATIAPETGTGIFHADTRGGFGPWVGVGTDERPYAIHVADVDGDGRPDLLVGHVEARPVVHFNDGPGRFTSVWFGDAEGSAYGFDVADIDGDGLNDIAMARSGAVNVLYFGGGPPAR